MDFSDLLWCYWCHTFRLKEDKQCPKCAHDLGKAKRECKCTDCTANR